MLVYLERGMICSSVMMVGSYLVVPYAILNILWERLDLPSEEQVILTSHLLTSGVIPDNNTVGGTAAAAALAYALWKKGGNVALSSCLKARY